ncbi:hypothetical protein H7992_13365 [Sporosarcina sp. resist]|uniref:hypothetical protein n=1 Tax=Sporosarcina sp. resist TaxID=2762563 RepID=UPI00164D35CB|nr:hypothetical protein [Sporosarcina sp. resist]QNK86260.1 hypothetical protein H7992_13365 [Sporosarcina sp. resist]
MNLEIDVEREDLQDDFRYYDYFGLNYEGFLFDAFPEFKAAYVADAEKMMRAIGYKILANKKDRIPPASDNFILVCQH